EMIDKEEKKDKKEKRDFKMNSIGVKFSVIFIIVSIVSISIVGYLNYRNSYDALREDMITSSTQTIEFVDLTIDNYLEGIEKQAELLSFNSLLLDTYHNQEDEALEAVVLNELN